MAKVNLTYYLDVLSSWCLIAEDALAKTRAEFGDLLEYDWRIAPLRDPLNYSPEQLAWYYRRTASVTGVRLNPIWLTSTADGTRIANLATEAARSLGCTGDDVRLALARAAMVDGKHISRPDVALDVAARAGGLDRNALERVFTDPQTAKIIDTSGAHFAEFNVSVRPTFVLRSAIGDTTILSGCWRTDVLAANVRALIDDRAGYESFTAANPVPKGAV